MSTRIVSNVEQPSEARDRFAATWSAIAWVGAFVVLAGALAGIAFVTSLSSCHFTLGGCGESDESLQAGSLGWIALACVALLAGAFLGARRSGWPPGRARLQAALAVGGGVVAALVGAELFEAVVDSSAPAAVLALGGYGALAVRSPSRRATALRLAAVGGLSVVAAAVVAGGADGAVVALALVTLPAVGIADTVALHEKAQSNPSIQT